MVTYSIADVADRTGLTAHTLRYYERDELMLRPVARDSGGRRVYDDEDLGWIRMLTCLRATGMPIREIRHYAELVRDGGREQDRLDLLLEHRAAVVAQLAEVQEHLGAIEAKIDLYRALTSSAREGLGSVS